MKIILTIIILITFASCYYDSKEYLYPTVNTSCDTLNVTYSVSVKKILSDNCYGCHSNSTYLSGGGYKLEDYADVKTSVDNNKLLPSVTTTNTALRMPKGGPPLSSCSIKILTIWINAGALNN